MAKKATRAKKTIVTRSVDSVANPGARSVARDSVLGASISDVEGKSAKAGLLVGGQSAIHVLPVPALAVRYLLQNEGWPLSRVYQFVGAEGSYKSTTLAEVMRWHWDANGFGVLNEAETKPTPDLRNSIVNWEPNAIRVEDCHALEDWQWKAVSYVNSIKKQCDKVGGPGRTIPVCIGVDSLLGKASRHTLAAMDKKGHADRHYALEANLIKDFMQWFPQKLYEWPFTFIGINHLKMGTNDIGMPVRNIPGGMAIKFQETVQIEIGLQRQETQADCKISHLVMQTYKNSYGPKNTRIHVKLTHWYQNDAAEGAEPIFRLHSRYEWWEASILFLFKGLGMRKTESDRLMPKIKDIIDLHEKSAGNQGLRYWSNRLGVTSADPVTAHELGMLLETNVEVLGELYTVLGINRRPFFQPTVDYLQQLEEYTHVIRQADAASEAVQRAAALSGGDA